MRKQAPRQARWRPQAMSEAPSLPGGATPLPTPNRILLINPFYAKDPHASFGKHVLTPTLALTSIAAATPPDWDIAYWDENLLQGAAPTEPFPAIVGITVHLRFASRAFELADWFRSRGSTVILGGLHVEGAVFHSRARKEDSSGEDQNELELHVRSASRQNPPQGSHQHHQFH